MGVHMFRYVFNFLNTNSGAFSAILTAALIIITGWYVRLTKRMVEETKSIRQKQSAPDIAVFYRNRSDSVNVINLIIKNFGYGAAYDIKFTVNPDFIYRTGAKISEINLFKNGLYYLPPGEERSIFLTILFNKAMTDQCKNLDIHVVYTDEDEKSYQADYKVDLTELFGLILDQNPPIVKIADNLEKIKDEIHKLFQAWPEAKVLMFTPEDMEKEEKRNLTEDDKNGAR